MIEEFKKYREYTTKFNNSNNISYTNCEYLDKNNEKLQSIETYENIVSF